MKLADRVLNGGVRQPPPQVHDSPYIAYGGAVQRVPGRYLGGLFDAPLWADWTLYLAGLGVVSQWATLGTDPTTGRPVSSMPVAIGNAALGSVFTAVLFGIVPAYARLRLRRSGKPLHWSWHTLGDVWLAVVWVTSSAVAWVARGWQRRRDVPRMAQAVPGDSGHPLRTVAAPATPRTPLEMQGPTLQVVPAHPADRNDSDQTFEYDVALSFAGEDRPYVEAVALILNGRGVKVFYDAFEIVENWGRDLYRHFDEIYRKSARFAVVFVSEHYVSKAWTLHESRSAQARALVSPEAYLLPVRLDDSELPGLTPTIGFIDARRYTAADVAEFIAQKCHGEVSRATTQAVGVPKNETESALLLATRPPLWEYLLFAGVLAQRQAVREPQWRDHEMRYRRADGPRLDDGSALDFAQEALDRMGSIISNAQRVLSPEVQQRAFGPPGTAGDPERIDHLATRLVDVYGDMLDWSSNVRSTHVSDRLERMFGLLAELATLPLQQFRAFIGDLHARLATLPEVLARTPESEPIRMQFMLELTVDPVLLRDLRREFRRARR